MRGCATQEIRIATAASCFHALAIHNEANGIAQAERFTAKKRLRSEIARPLKFGEVFPSVMGAASPILNGSATFQKFPIRLRPGQIDGC